MQLTNEQYEAVKLFHSGGNLVVNAFAGTGKTTTAIALAESISSAGLYLAFNRSIADDIKRRYRQLNLDSRTTHSLASRYVRSASRYREEKLFTEIPINFLVERAELKDFDIDLKVVVKARGFAHILKETIKSFCNGGSEKILIAHVPIYGMLPTLNKKTLDGFREYVVSVAEYVWSEMVDESSDFPLGHDGYLKVWSLAAPELPYDFVLLDEAQDTNDAVLSVLTKRANRIVYIGDRYQQIYSWRGAINAMSKITDANYAFLTQSFRFGDCVAELANSILHKFSEPERVIGNPQVRTTINGPGSQTTICRTNSGVLASLMTQLNLNRKTFVLGGIADLRRIMDDIGSLKAGRPVASNEFFGFKNWKEVCEFAESDDGRHLHSLVKIVATYGEDHLIRALDKCVHNEQEAQVVVTTAHKAKGREWANTEISPDFISSWLKVPGELIREETKEEARLLYVALTRCKENLRIPEELLNHLDGSRTTGEKSISATFAPATESTSPRRPIPPSFIRER